MVIISKGSQLVSYYLLSYPEETIKIEFARSLSANPNIIQLDVFMKNDGNYTIDLECSDDDPNLASQIEKIDDKHYKALFAC